MAKRLPKIISQEEFERLFTGAKRERDRCSKIRKLKINKYMIAMLLGFEAGMRISEIVGWSGGKRPMPPLSPEKVSSAQIRIEGGKGGKDRIVPRPKRLNDSAVRQLPLDISRRSLQNFVTTLGHRILDKHMTFHTLRHGFVTHLINNGRPLHEIQMLAGHSRLDTTGLYLHADPRKAIDSARDVF